MTRNNNKYHTYHYYILFFKVFAVFVFFGGGVVQASFKSRKKRITPLADTM